MGRAARAWTRALAERGAQVGLDLVDVLELVLESLSKNSGNLTVDAAVWPLLLAYEEGRLHEFLAECELGPAWDS